MGSCRIQLLRASRRRSQRRWLGLLPVVALLWAANVGPIIFAQDDDADPPAEVQDVGFEIEGGQFDSWIFQNLENASTARKQLELMLSLHADDVNRVCNLTAIQRKKLQLAGAGDLKRFFEQVEAVRQKFQLVRKDQHKFAEIWELIEPLQMTVQTGLHGEDSLFQKTLRKILDDQQRADYSQNDLERRKFRYRAKIEWVVSQLESILPLRDEQRQKLIALLVEQTQPPRQFGQQDYYVVLWNLSKLPESSLKPLFDDTEWKILQHQFDQIRGMGRWLKESGLVEEEEKNDQIPSPNDQ